MSLQYFTKVPTVQQLLHLYEDAKWTSYTKDTDKLHRAIVQSAFVLACYDNQQLVGLIRAVGDQETILYIQDILVLTSYQRKGIGTTLMRKTLEKYQHIRQIILLTDETPKTRAFYESFEMESCDDGKLVAFARFNK